MADERRDGNLLAFLVGFALGALLAGGAAGGFMLFQYGRLRDDAMRAERDAAVAAQMALDQEALARRMAEEADRKLKAAREALEKLKGK